MSNIPAGDAGLVLVPGAVSWSEWNVRFAGKIATCVEVSEMVVSHLTKAGFPLSDAEDRALAQDLIDRGEADPDGATNYAAASRQMTRNGIPNTAYGADWFAAHDFVPLCKDALRRGVPVLFGFSEAHNAHDDWTGTNTNGGVFGHAVALVGFDDHGAVVADPNTQQATVGNFVHYAWANLKAAGGAWPSMVIPKGRMMVVVARTWNGGNSTLAFPAHDGLPAITLEHSQAFFGSSERTTVYPLAPAGYEGNDSVVYWSDGQKSVSVKSENWAVHLEDGAPTLAHWRMDRDALAAQVAALEAELKKPATNPAPDPTLVQKAAAYDKMQAAILTLAKLGADGLSAPVLTSGTGMKGLA